MPKGKSANNMYGAHASAKMGKGKGKVSIKSPASAGMKKK